MEKRTVSNDFWYNPEQVLPNNDEEILVAVSGVTHIGIFTHGGFIYRDIPIDIDKVDVWAYIPGYIPNSNKEHSKRESCCRIVETYINRCIDCPHFRIYQDEKRMYTLGVCRNVGNQVKVIKELMGESLWSEVVIPDWCNLKIKEE